MNYNSNKFILEMQSLVNSMKEKKDKVKNLFKGLSTESAVTLPEAPISAAMKAQLYNGAEEAIAFSNAVTIYSGHLHLKRNSRKLIVTS